MHPDMFSLSAMKENNFLMISGVVALIITNFIATYMGTIFFIYIRGMVKLIVNLNKFGTVGSRRRFESRMQKVSPEFSYEYFTSKAISLIKTAVFSEDEKELALYVGDRLDLRMKDIIDLNYGGALGVIKFKDEGDFVTVKTKAYFDVLYAKGNKVYYKPQVFSATLKRRTDIPVDFNFSMTKISCPSCGASFDATKLKKCPYCENEYDITSDDWALIELKYN
jgi:predicted Zn-ribbon and HTH transcriptional regulator